MFQRHVKSVWEKQAAFRCMFAMDFSGQTRLAFPLHMDQYNRGLADRGVQQSSFILYST